MIKQLFDLKQQQINRQLQLKQQAMSKIDDIDKEMAQTDNNLHSANVGVMGSISDFRVLEIHKSTLKEHMVKLNKTKEMLKKQIVQYDKIIVELNKESEQFNYILQEQKKEELKKILKNEETVSAEYMQAKYARRI